MRTAKTISITLPPDLLTIAQQTAEREHRTMSELFREALRRYLTPDVDKDWATLMKKTRAAGKKMGIRSEEDVDRLIHEFRAERRR